jgi:SAM-dependent methyltransferase
MGAPTFGEYAPYYDLLYHDKDYEAESRFVAGLLRDHGPRAPRLRLLDLACGTGRHAQELARMGYHVEGSDLSREMVDIARSRAAQAGLPLEFHNESFQTSDRIGRKYHAVLALFSAIDYLTSWDDLARALRNVRALLEPDGVFIFDFWNGNAVVTGHSPVRVKRAARGEDAVLRISTTSLDRVAQVASVHFDFMLMRTGATIREFSEDHAIRYFFPQEMADLLAAGGFGTVHRCPFMQPGDPILPDDWNLTYVARPCG